MESLKKLRGFFLLALFLFSIFTLIVTPFEMKQTIQAQNWDSVEVEILSNEILRGSRGFYPEVRVKNLETEEISSTVSFRYGDFSHSITFLGWLANSSMYADRDKYPDGTIMTAYHSPDGKRYVLEQNSITLMLIMFSLALIYPLITIVSIWKAQTSDS